MREEGFYWVRYRGSLPTIGLWEDDAWDIIGVISPHSEEGVVVASEKLEPPST